MSIIETVTGNGSEMKCTVFGTGAKQMVMIPGLSITGVWELAEQVAEAYSCFCEEYTVYLFDRCDEIPAGYTMNGMAEDAAAGMKALGIKSAYVFGASQGGMIALYIAEHYPELVKSLAVCSTSALIRDDFREVCTNWNRFALKKDSKGLAKYFYEVLFSDKTMTEYGEAMLADVPEYSDAQLARFINLVKAFESLNIKDGLKYIKCPVLVAAALNDRVFGYYASEELAEELNCELVTYGEGFGHAVYDEAPDFKTKLMNFFNNT